MSQYDSVRADLRGKCGRVDPDVLLPPHVADLLLAEVAKDDPRYIAHNNAAGWVRVIAG